MLRCPASRARSPGAEHAVPSPYTLCPHPTPRALPLHLVPSPYISCSHPTSHALPLHLVPYPYISCPHPTSHALALHLSVTRWLCKPLSSSIIREVTCASPALEVRPPQSTPSWPGGGAAWERRFGVSVLGFLLGEPQITAQQLLGRKPCAGPSAHCAEGAAGHTAGSGVGTPWGGGG